MAVTSFNDFYGDLLNKYKNQWNNFYNRNIEGRAAGWANDPRLARNAYWNTSDFYKNMLNALPGAARQYYLSHGWTETHPGQWTLGNNVYPNYGAANGQVGGFLNPYVAQQAAKPSPQVIAGRKQLGSIADQLQAAADKAAIPPPPTGKPILTGQPTTPAVNYVDSSRLEEGKGFSKFKRQARGTDRYAMVNSLINQYYK